MSDRSRIYRLNFAFVTCLVFGINCIFPNQSTSGDTLHLQSGEIQLPPYDPTTSGETIAPPLLGPLRGSGNPSDDSAEEKSDPTRTMVVQFKTRITGDLQSKLRRNGAKILGYIPDDALIIRIKTSKLAKLPTIIDPWQASSEFLPAWKISPDLMSQPSHGSATAGNERQLFSISFFWNSSGKPQEEWVRRYRKRGGTVPAAHYGYVIIEATRAEALRLAFDESVQWIERTPSFELLNRDILGLQPPTDATSARDSSLASNEPRWTGYESGTKLVNFEEAWKRGYAGEDQVLGFMDTGVDVGHVGKLHPDLENVSQGFNLSSGLTEWFDPIGHGTHIAGLMVGNGALSNGLFKAGAYKAKLIASTMRMIDQKQITLPPNAAHLFDRAYDEGVRIHSNSWGSSGNPGGYDALTRSIDAYLWDKDDLLGLFAVGNNGSDLNRDGRIDEKSLCTPSTAKNVLSVGASENLLTHGGNQERLGSLNVGKLRWSTEPLASDRLSDNARGLAAFSSRGPTRDGRIKPEIVAPGTNIVGPRSRHPQALTLWGRLNEDYVFDGGTSMATPIAASAAAIAREFMKRRFDIKNPSSALLKAVLMHTAYDLYPGQFGIGPKQELPTPRPNVHEGYGRVDMGRLMALGEKSLDTEIKDQREGVATGAHDNITVTIRPNRPNLRITLVYTDAPAAPTAAKMLVNDLDLELINSKDEVISPRDRTNNHEMIEVKNLPAGEYIARVRGINVPRGRSGTDRQPYALVISAAGAE